MHSDDVWRRGRGARRLTEPLIAKGTSAQCARFFFFCVMFVFTARKAFLFRDRRWVCVEPFAGASLICAFALLAWPCLPLMPFSQAAGGTGFKAWCRVRGGKEAMSVRVCAERRLDGTSVSRRSNACPSPARASTLPHCRRSAVR